MTGLEWFLYVLVVACGVAGVGYGVVTRGQVLALPAGNEKMQSIAAAVQEGARAYLNRQYMTIAGVGVVVFLLLTVFLGIWVGLGYLIGVPEKRAYAWLLYRALVDLRVIAWGMTPVNPLSPRWWRRVRSMRVPALATR